MTDVANVFRVILQVSDLEKAVEFYSKLFDAKGRRIRGARHYFDCGSVILAIVDPTSDGEKAKKTPDYLYLAVRDLEKVHARARSLGCLSKEKVHEDPAGDIVTRPWGERSFYAEDPWQNPLCFVEEGTVYAG